MDLITAHFVHIDVAIVVDGKDDDMEKKVKHFAEPTVNQVKVRSYKNVINEKI